MIFLGIQARTSLPYQVPELRERVNFRFNPSPVLSV
jgi:hypothetical protein